MRYSGALTRFPTDRFLQNRAQNTIDLSINVVLAPPLDLVVQSTGVAHIELAWAYDAEVLFRIYRDGVAYATSSFASFIDTAVSDEFVYTYTVTAEVASTASAHSNAVTATPVDTRPPSQPTNLTAVVT